MGRYAEKTSITEQERLQLAGLLAIARDVVREEKRIVGAVAGILGEDPENGHAADAVYNGYSVDELLTKSEITVQSPGETHRGRHVELHQAFDELAADFLRHNRGALPGKSTLLELMRWSHDQTVQPTEADPVEPVSIVFTVDGSERRENDRCDYRLGAANPCGAPGAYWYPASGGGVAVLCEAHGAKHFPHGAQRITDTTWHGGGESVGGDG